VSAHQEQIRERVRAYYDARLAEHGPTARGVDWGTEESQRLRFAQLARVFEPARGAFSLVDYGCGYGALAGFLEEHGRDIVYTGFDLSEAMVRAARARYGERPGRRFTCARTEVPVADYTVASGILNVRAGAEEAAWEGHVLETIADLARLSRRGFAFNCLTRYSDPERMEQRLHYADPVSLFDHCRSSYSRWVALLHDYGLFEFTIVVRAAEEGAWQRS
jgi:SAM-dependent methyltransferase